MSDFHGGYFVQTVDAAVLEPIRRVMRDYLFRETKEAHLYEIAIATRRGAPVLHLAVRGQDADGKGYCIFHQKHARLGADIARAARANVFAYHYENQSGSEGVTTFDANGKQV